MLNVFWNVLVITLTLLSIAACWWLLQWTKGISNRNEDDIGTTGHIWDGDLEELNHPLPRWWLYLFHLTIVFALVYFVLYPALGNVNGVLGWSQVEQYEAEMAAARTQQSDVYAQFEALAPEALAANPEAMGIGRRIFAGNCAMCHGSDGRGGTGFPNLADQDWLYGGQLDAVVTSIAQGRNGMMPAMGASLGEDGVTEVVAYVQSLSGMAVDDQSIAAGGEKFGMFCAACHGADGKGNPALGAPNLTDSIWLYGSDSEVIAETINKGRSGMMPAHADKLTDDQIKLLAVFVQSLSEGSE